jgi:hypothetical protein
MAMTRVGAKKNKNRQVPLPLLRAGTELRAISYNKLQTTSTKQEGEM